MFVLLLCALHTPCNVLLMVCIQDLGIRMNVRPRPILRFSIPLLCSIETKEDPEYKKATSSHC